MKLAQVKKVSGFETGDGAMVVPGKKAGVRGQGSGAGAAAAKDMAKVEKALLRSPGRQRPSTSTSRMTSTSTSRSTSRSAPPEHRGPKESAFVFPRPPAAPVARGHGRFLPLRAGSEGRVPLDARPKRAAPEIEIAPKRERGRALPREAPARVPREEDDSRPRGGRR